MDFLDRIAGMLGAATDSLGDRVGQERAMQLLERWGTSGAQLAALLAARNGFYAYGRALLFRPLSSSDLPLGLMQWNQDSLWRSRYDPEFGIGDCLFFAEDAFGEQFCLAGSGVSRFNPETGELRVVGESLDSLIALILSEPAVVTAHTLLRAWEDKNGPIAPGQRLAPATPFVLGGEYEPSNLYSLSDVESLCARAEIANQIRTLPDGAQVVLRVDGGE